MGKRNKLFWKIKALTWFTEAQKIYWKEPLTARKEFQRILKPGGHIALNIRWNILPNRYSFLLDINKKVVILETNYR